MPSADSTEQHRPIDAGGTVQEYPGISLSATNNNPQQTYTRSLIHATMELLQRARQSIEQKGFVHSMKNSIPYIYNNHIVKLLPRRKAMLNGVETNGARLFDEFIPWRNMSPNRNHFESGLIASIENYVQEGDDVVIVGGGWGVTTVKAAEEAGKGGSVTVFEGSLENKKKIQETLSLNDITHDVKVRHAIVGPKISLMGGGEEGVLVDPKDLPCCDVLELDCEGSEIEILKGLEQRPRHIFVESHGMNGAPSQEIKDILRDMSYSIVFEEVADEELRTLCEKNDIMSIAAVIEK